MIKNIAFDLLKFFIEFIKLFPVMYIIMDFELQNKKKILLYSLGAIFLCIIASLSGISGIMPITAYICFIYTILILKGKFFHKVASCSKHLGDIVRCYAHCPLIPVGCDKPYVGDFQRC